MAFHLRINSRLNNYSREEVIEEKDLLIEYQESVIKLRRERLELIDEEGSEEEDADAPDRSESASQNSVTDKEEGSAVLNPLKSPDGSEAKYNMLKGLVKGQLEDSPDMKTINVEKQETGGKDTSIVNLDPGRKNSQRKSTIKKSLGTFGNDLDQVD